MYIKIDIFVEVFARSLRGRFKVKCNNGTGASKRSESYRESPNIF